jgi:hypothetical protein
MFLYRRCRFSGSDDGPSRRLQFGGSLLFCCAGGGNCRTFAATIPPDSRIDSFSGRLHSDGSRKHRCQRLNEFFRTASHASNRRNTRRNQRNEKSVGGHFYAGGDRNGISHSATDLPKKNLAFKLMQNETLHEFRAVKLPLFCFRFIRVQRMNSMCHQKYDCIKS